MVLDDQNKIVRTLSYSSRPPARVSPRPRAPEQSAGDELRGVDADRKADTLRRQDHGGVHADDIAARVDERAAGVARVERGVGLDDAVDETSALRAHRSTQRADDAGGDGALEP